MDLVGIGFSQTHPLPQTSSCQMNYSVNAGGSGVVVSPPSSLHPDCDLLLSFDLAFRVLTIPFSCHPSLHSLELALISFLFVSNLPRFPPFLLPLMLQKMTRMDVFRVSPSLNFVQFKLSTV